MQKICTFANEVINVQRGAAKIKWLKQGWKCFSGIIFYSVLYRKSVMDEVLAYPLITIPLSLCYIYMVKWKKHINKGNQTTFVI